MSSELADAWRINCAMSMLLLDALPKGGLEARYTPKTRTVAAQFAHVHNVRVYQIGKRGADHLGALAAFPRGAQPTRAQLTKALKASEKAMAKVLTDIEGAGVVKGWKGPPASYLGYLVAHESHHRALVNVCLRMAGIKIPDEAKYGIWDGWRKGTGSRHAAR